jgi:hypothetical protein
MVDLQRYELPEPSGEVEWRGELENSYGGHGCYQIGDDQIENPAEDIRYYAQQLSNALAAFEFETTVKVDNLAALARASYYGESVDASGWDGLSTAYKDRWRYAIRQVLLHEC